MSVTNQKTNRLIIYLQNIFRSHNLPRNLCHLPSGSPLRPFPVQRVPHKPRPSLTPPSPQGPTFPREAILCHRRPQSKIRVSDRFGVTSPRHIPVYGQTLELGGVGGATAPAAITRRGSDWRWEAILVAVADHFVTAASVIVRDGLRSDAECARALPRDRSTAGFGPHDQRDSEGLKHARRGRGVEGAVRRHLPLSKVFLSLRKQHLRMHYDKLGAKIRWRKFHRESAVICCSYLGFRFEDVSFSSSFWFQSVWMEGFWMRERGLLGPDMTLLLSRQTLSTNNNNNRFELACETVRSDTQVNLALLSNLLTDMLHSIADLRMDNHTHNPRIHGKSKNGYP